MKAYFTAKVLLAAIALSGAGAIAANAQSTPANKTVFDCIQQDGNWATVARRGDKTSTPLIVWTTSLSSDTAEGSYTPERRCGAVSTRLTNLTSALGQGSFGNLWLDYGTVNNQVAICVYHGSQIGCTARNVVFTLKPENAPYASEILGKLKQFSQTGSGSPIFESSDDSEEIPSRAVSLEAWEKEAFGSESEATPGNSGSGGAPAQSNPAPNSSGGSMF